MSIMEIAMRNADTKQKKLRFKLCPDLVDGDHWTVVNTPADVAEAVRMWAENMKGDFNDGDEIKIKCVLMTDAEVDALPEI